VNRFLPGSPYDKAKQSAVTQDVKAAWLSEKRTMQAFTTILAMIILIFILSRQ
jgi:hypothetical protein